MNYIYDVLINPNKVYYDFFEWNQNDSIYHVRKIPIFRIKSNDFLNLLTNNIKVDEKFIESIKGKTDFFGPNKDELKYCCLFTDSNDVVVVIFDMNGNSILKSDLLIEESLDILEISLRISEKNIKYKSLNNSKDNKFMTRNMSKMRNRLLKKINSFSKEDIIKLKYIYYECFNEEENDYNKMINKLKKNIDNNDILNKLNNFFKLISYYK